VGRSPGSVVDEAARADCAILSYTYVEPTVFNAYDCARLAKDKGTRNVFVSNGYMTAEVIRHLAPVLDGINIDLKAFTDDFYKEVCKARLEPVLESIRLFHKLGMLVEVTTLVIPGLNDSDEELLAITRFLRSVSPQIPWHVSGFYPTYKMLDRPATPLATLKKACEIGLAEGLRFVYEGNVPGSGGEDTFCPGCSTRLIQRSGFSSQTVAMIDGRCDQCVASIAGVWR